MTVNDKKNSYSYFISILAHLQSKQLTYTTYMPTKSNFII